MSFTDDQYPIAWIDLETTGLTADDHHILEVACIVTDPQLNVLDEVGFHRVIGYTESQIRVVWSEADAYVRNMHQETGLWDKLGLGTPIQTVDEELKSYLSEFSDRPRAMPVGGNSNRLDMNFLDRWMPRTSEHLSYRARDASQLAGFVHDWYPDEPWFEKQSDHTAMVDITESIREAQHYRLVLAARAISDYLKSTAEEVPDNSVAESVSR